MRGSLRTLFFATAALGAAVVLFVALTLPPAALDLGGRVPPTFVTGAYHIHSNRSDGTGSIDDIAKAAAEAGLAFVVVTDHGDATRAPDAPAYRSGVLVIDAVEVNTTAGHVVALGLDRASPYPLAGGADDVIEDIHRMGGRAVIAHPDSPKDALRWRAFNATFDGIEWLNADAEWRDERPRHLVTTAARALFRAPEAIASLFATPTRTLERWDRAALVRPVFGVAALDAHANIPWRESEEPRARTAFAWPSYRSMFETLAQTVILDAPLSGRADDDARRVLDAITSGRSFSIVRAFAAPASLEFTGEQGGRRTPMGGRISAGPTTFRAVVAEAPGARLVLTRNGRTVATAGGTLQHADERASGVYRVSAFLADRSAPWLMSNPIVVGEAAGPAPVPGALPAPAETIDLRTPDHPWSVERDQTSSGTLEIAGLEMKFDYRLGSGAPSGQFAALAGLVGSEAGVDRVTFTARADRPMRVSLQVRVPRGNARRWRRSVYLDQTERTVTVALPDFEPADVVATSRPIVTPLHSVLFVVDTLNSTTGSSGTIWVSDVTLGTRTP